MQLRQSRSGRLRSTSTEVLVPLAGFTQGRLGRWGRYSPASMCAVQIAQPEDQDTLPR